MKEKVVIITGAAGGLGRAFALGFASAGAKVAVCDLNLAGAEETAAMVGEDALALKVDVADEALRSTPMLCWMCLASRLR